MKVHGDAFGMHGIATGMTEFTFRDVADSFLAFRT
jgi:hypothetical protein